MSVARPGSVCPRRRLVSSSLVQGRPVLAHLGVVRGATWTGLDHPAFTGCHQLDAHRKTKWKTPEPSGARHTLRQAFDLGIFRNTAAWFTGWHRVSLSSRTDGSGPEPLQSPRTPDAMDPGSRQAGRSWVIRIRFLDRDSSRSSCIHFCVPASGMQSGRDWRRPSRPPLPAVAGSGKSMLQKAGMGSSCRQAAATVPILEQSAAHGRRRREVVRHSESFMTPTYPGHYVRRKPAAQPAGAVTAAIEMLRVGSDVVDVGPAASHRDARPVSPADEIRRIAPLLDALSDQMHRVSTDSFQPETQRYALKRGVGYLNDIQISWPCALSRYCWGGLQAGGYALSGGMASPPAPVTFDPKTRSTRLCGSSRRGFPPCDGAGSLPTGSSSIRDGIFLEPRTGNIAARAVEP